MDLFVQVRVGRLRAQHFRFLLELHDALVALERALREVVRVAIDQVLRNTTQVTT